MGVDGWLLNAYAGLLLVTVPSGSRWHGRARSEGADQRHVLLWGYRCVRRSGAIELDGGRAWLIAPGHRGGVRCPRGRLARA